MILCGEEISVYFSISISEQRKGDMNRRDEAMMISSRHIETLRRNSKDSRQHQASGSPVFKVSGARRDNFAPHVGKEVRHMQCTNYQT